MSVDAISNMELGQVVDYVIEYNEIHGVKHEEGIKQEPGDTIRQATQSDWDWLMG